MENGSEADKKESRRVVGGHEVVKEEVTVAWTRAVAAEGNEVEGASGRPCHGIQGGQLPGSRAALVKH